MPRVHAFALVVLMISLVRPAGAAVFERDWKVPGDGLLTFDDESQRLWLDIPVSLLSQFEGATIEARFQDSLAELEPGGLFEGFMLASQSDLVALAESAGIDTSTNNYAINQAPVDSLLDLLERTLVGPGGRSTRGVLSNIAGPPPAPCPCHLIANFGAGQSGQGLVAGLWLYSTAETGLDDQGIPITGVFLYRQIPEPPSVFLAAFGVLVLSRLERVRRRRRIATWIVRLRPTIKDI